MIFERYNPPLFFVTACVRDRRPFLANDAVSGILTDGWRNSLDSSGWMVGRYVIMPDHVHFFAAPAREDAKDLSYFIRDWKRWTCRRIRDSGAVSFAWQGEFFDHLLRSNESYAEKWEYVRMNPVRAELVDNPDAWPYQGEIHPLQG